MKTKLIALLSMLVFSATASAQQPGGRGAARVVIHDALGKTGASPEIVTDNRSQFKAAVAAAVRPSRAGRVEGFSCRGGSESQLVEAKRRKQANDAPRHEPGGLRQIVPGVRLEVARACKTLLLQQAKGLF